MKLTAFFRLAFSLLLPLCATHQATACVCSPPHIPMPEFFALSRPQRFMADYDRYENLRLWQALTSERIPLSDIENAVYRDSQYDFQNYSIDPTTTNNTFYTYLKNSQDYEVKGLLWTAKSIEEKRRKTQSPWYYPQKQTDTPETGDYANDIEDCLRYEGNRLRDRYSLQITRALFASRQYAACINFTDSAFSYFPETNLMKRMARRYVAGCWNRLGYKLRADSLFAQEGDIWSISATDPIAYMVEHNPNAPQLMEYIRQYFRTNANDSARQRAMIPIAKQVLKKKGIKNKGDWYYMLAYASKELDGNPKLARKQVGQALQHSFSSDELHDLARAYKIKLDADARHTESLLANLKWLESKTDILNPDANEWARRVRNIVYGYLVPAFMHKQDYSTAIMLCAYADFLSPNYQYISAYSCLSFQLMGSLSSSRLAAVHAQMMTSSPLYDFLRKHIRTDNDYYYELIGTLALREENYTRAEKYLSRISHHYQRSMNIYPYLSRDPFRVYPSRWYTEKGYDGETYEYEAGTDIMPELPNPSTIDVKLNFAHKMSIYQHDMKYGRTADKRGLARLMYAIGRKNSFEECWALTQYWRGEIVDVYSPTFWNDSDECIFELDLASDAYKILYDYNYTIGHKQTEAIYEREVSAALAMLTTDEARAEAEYILGNLKTIIKRYGNTSTADIIKSSCDNWKSWL